MELVFYDALSNEIFIYNADIKFSECMYKNGSMKKMTFLVKIENFRRSIFFLDFLDPNY